MSEAHSDRVDVPCPACGDLDGCHLPGHRRAELDCKTFSAISELQKEIDRARNKFPGGSLLTLALQEECGELARELLQNGNTEHARKEAIQVACVALRIATEGVLEVNNLTAEQRQK